MTRTKFPNGKKTFKRTIKPVKWNDDRCRQAYTLAFLFGATEEQIAMAMDVDINTIGSVRNQNSWKHYKKEN